MASNASTAGSCLVSLSIISEQYRDDLAGLLGNTELDLEDISVRANKEIDWLQERTDRFYAKIDVALVLEAMYDVSFSLGENSRRYTACAIAACHRDKDEERQRTLMELGDAWITHFLSPCTLRRIPSFPLT
jgi:hypothetical protein